MFKISPPLLAKLTGTADARTFTATGISTDSRTLKRGELFIALSGPNFDGHTYAPQALAAGACGLVVERLLPNLPPEKQIITLNCQHALEVLAQHKRAAFTGATIGLTGSAGKTSTREGLAYILSKFGPTYSTQGNHNNHIGTPLTLCHLPEDAAFAVLEMGMSHAGEIRTLTHQVKPDIALVTNVYPMHIEFFENLAGIAAAKAEIFEGLSPQGIAILNQDTAHSDILLKAATKTAQQTLTFGGPASGADVTYTTYTEAAGTTHVTASVCGQKVAFTLSTLGVHRVYNALAILSVVHALGLDVQHAAPFLADLSPLPGRGKVHQIPLPKGGTFTLIDESYSGQPASTKLALNTLSATTPNQGGRRLAILGQMAELGEHSTAEHEALGHHLATLKLDYVLGVGAPMQAALAHCPHPHSLRQNSQGLAAELLNTLAQRGDVVLIKGSHYGSRLFEVVAELLAHPHKPQN